MSSFKAAEKEVGTMLFLPLSFSHGPIPIYHLPFTPVLQRGNRKATTFFLDIRQLLETKKNNYWPFLCPNDISKIAVLPALPNNKHKMLGFSFLKREWGWGGGVEGVGIEETCGI